MVGRPRTTSDGQILAATGQAISDVGPSEGAHRSPTSPARPGSPLPPSSSASVPSVRSYSRSPPTPPLASRRVSPPPSAHTRPLLPALVGHLIAMASGIRTPDELSRHLAFLLQLELGDPEFHQHTRRHADAMRKQVRLLLEAAVDSGELKPCDTKRLADALHITYNGALITWAILRRGSLTQHLRRELEFILAAASDKRAASVTRCRRPGTSQSIRGSGICSPASAPAPRCRESRRAVRRVRH